MDYNLQYFVQLGRGYPHRHTTHNDAVLVP